MDARLLLETDDGAMILVRYEGRIVYHDNGASVMIAPTFETNDERYAWLNSVQGIGKGERVGTTLIYDLYEVASGGPPGPARGGAGAKVRREPSRAVSLNRADEEAAA